MAMTISKDSPWLTANDLAERFGVSTNTIKAWRKKRQGPAGVRLGGSVRYHVDTVEQWERSLSPR